MGQRYIPLELTVQMDDGDGVKKSFKWNLSELILLNQKKGGLFILVYMQRI